MKSFTKHAKTGVCCILSFVMAMLMLVSTWWNIGSQADAAPIDSNAAIDLNLDYGKIESMLNAGYTIREIDYYLKGLGNISNVSGVKVTACLALELAWYNNPILAGQGWYDYRTWNFTNYYTYRSVDFCLRDYYDFRFNRDTLNTIRTESNDHYMEEDQGRNDYTMKNLTYRIHFKVSVENEGVMSLGKSTKFTIDNEKFSMSYITVTDEKYIDCYKDVYPSSNAQPHVSYIAMEVRDQLKQGYVTFNNSTEQAVDVKKKINFWNKDNNDYAYYTNYLATVKKGITYRIYANVSQYGTSGEVHWDFYDEGGAAYDPSCGMKIIRGWGANGVNFADIYISPNDPRNHIEINVSSVDDPSVTSTIWLTVQDREPARLLTIEENGSETKEKNYISFSGKSRVYVGAIGEDGLKNLFHITEECNDQVIGLEMEGNEKPITWFDSKDGEKYLFSIDKAETSRHLVLTAYLRNDPDQQVKCHYYLSNEWTQVAYQIDGDAKHEVVYSYPVKENFFLADGAEILAKFAQLYPEAVTEKEGKVICGWTINRKYYGPGQATMVDGAQAKYIAEPRWIANPVTEQPQGSTLDTTSKSKNVSCSTSFTFDTTNTGDITGVHLQKYDKNTEEWVSVDSGCVTNVMDFLNKPYSIILLVNGNSAGICGGLPPVFDSHGTYRYKIITGDTSVYLTDEFVVNVEGIVTQPVGKTLKCGDQVNVDFLVVSSGRNIRYEWYFQYNNTKDPSMWLKVEDFAEMFNVIGYDSVPMIVTCEPDAENRHYVMNGYVKCKVFDADTDELICETDSVYLNQSGHDFAIARSDDDNYHHFRCTNCGFESITLAPHSYVKRSYPSSPDMITDICKYCDHVRSNTKLPAKDTRYKASLVLHANDGTDTQKTVTGYQYEKKSLAKEAFLRNGYVQVGWAYKEYAVKPVYTMEDLVVLAGKDDLYAVWKPARVAYAFDLVTGSCNAGGLLQLNERSKAFDNYDELVDAYVGETLSYQWVRYDPEGNTKVVSTASMLKFMTGASSGTEENYSYQLRVYCGDLVVISQVFAYVEKQPHDMEFTVVTADRKFIEDANISIIDAVNGESVAGFHTNHEGYGMIMHIPQGKYIIRVDAEGYQAYECEIELNNHFNQTITLRAAGRLGTPAVTKLENSASGVKVTWGAVEGAEMYRVMYKEPNGTYKTGGYTASTSYTVKKLTSGVAYTFTVQCVTADKESSTSDYDEAGMTITYIAAPILIRVENAANGVKVTWEPSAGAELYKVMYKEPGGSYKTGGYTTDNNYTVIGLTAGVEYTFTARCMTADKKTYTSSYNSTGLSLVYQPAAAKLATPTITKLENASTGVKVTWGAVEGAQMYHVMYKEPGGTYKTGGYTASTSYTVKKLTSGVAYTFTVQCVTADKESSTSDYDEAGMTITYIAAPVLVSVENAADGVKVTWEPSAGAELYKVMYKEPGGSYKTGGYTTENNYTVTGLTAGVEYTFTARCMTADKKTYTSSYNSTGLSLVYQPAAAKLAAPVITKLENSASGVKVTWGAVEGAEMYHVMYKEPDGSYKSGGYTAGTDYTVKDVKGGVAYVFTVQCVTADKSTAASDYDEAGISITYIASPVLVKVENAPDGVTVTWKPSAGAERYKVLYKEPGGTYKTGGYTTENSYTVPKLTAGIEYTFSVRCVTADGKTYTSSYNKVGLTIVYQPAVTKLATPVITKLENTNTGVKVTWGAVEGAELYHVMYKEPDGSYKTGGYTSGTSYTVKDLTGGVAYAFTVQCVTADKSTATSDYDETGVSGTYIAAPVVLKVENAAGGVKVTWEASAGAELYKVMYMEPGSTWKTGGYTTDTEYTVKKLTEGSTYSFTVRCMTADKSDYTSGYDKTGLTITYEEP